MVHTTMTLSLFFITSSFIVTIPISLYLDDKDQSNRSVFHMICYPQPRHSPVHRIALSSHSPAGHVDNQSSATSRAQDSFGNTDGTMGAGAKARRPMTTPDELRKKGYGAHASTLYLLLVNCGHFYAIERCFKP